MPAGKKGVYESPQTSADGLSTVVLGGEAPSKEQVIKSANARGGKRHEMKGDAYADLNVLPKSGGDSLEKSGVNDAGYLTKKGTPYGVTALFNTLPPGTDIEDQENTDQRTMSLKNYSGGLSYPGDGGF